MGLNEHHHVETTPLVSRCFGGLAAVAALTLASAGFGQATGADAIGTFGLRANGGPLHSVQSEATLGADAGTVRFIGSAVDPAGAWEASWDYTADLDPHGNAKLNGSATILNKSASAIDFDLVFEVPMCPFIKTGSKMGGSCTIKITTNQNGGAISTPGGNAVFSALADGGTGAKLFHGPFNMGSTGSGTAQTANLFGAPFPAMTTPAISDRFGIRHTFKLTDGDTALLTGNLVVGGDPANFVECAEEENEPAAPAASVQGVTNPAEPMVAKSPASGSPSKSAVTLGATSSNRVTISHDSKSKRKSASASKSSRSSAAAKAKAKAAAQRKSAAQANRGANRR